MSFRVKLALAMLLAVVAVAGVTLVVIGRSVEGTYRQMFEERFESDVSLLAALQGARLGAVKSRCLGLARSVRLIAAMEEEDAALLHRIALDELWLIPVVSNSPASQGVRVIKNTMGNVPERLWNSAVSDNPHIAHTETWYFKS